MNTFSAAIFFPFSSWVAEGFKKKKKKEEEQKQKQNEKDRQFQFC